MCAQLEALRQGFFEIFPRHLLEKFTESELELVLCGLPEIDVKDWRMHTEYKVPDACVCARYLVHTDSPG
jgi:hypothetical protein